MLQQLIFVVKEMVIAIIEWLKLNGINESITEFSYDETKILLNYSFYSESGKNWGETYEIYRNLQGGKGKFLKSKNKKKVKIKRKKTKNK